MSRTPSACAPRSSDSRAMRFRSRVVKWTRHSRSRSCWMPNATDRQPIRTRAIALSLTLTRSTPAAWRSRAASIVRSMRIERGGSISTDTTKRPAASFSARPVGGGASSPAVGVDVADTIDARGRAAGAVERGSGAAELRCPCRARRSPPASPRCAPASCRSSRRRSVPPGRRAAAPSRRSRRVPPRTRTGRRCAGAGRRSGGSSGPIGSLAGTGPHERIEAGHRAGAAVDADDVDAGTRPGPRAASSGVVPSSSTSSSPNVSDATTGRSDAARASATDDEDVLERRERLDHEQVDAALQEAVELLAHGGSHLGRVDPFRAVARADERPDRPGDERIAAGHVPGLAGHLGGPPVQPVGLIGQPERSPAGTGSPRTWRSR